MRRESVEKLNLLADETPSRLQDETRVFTSARLSRINSWGKFFGLWAEPIAGRIASIAVLSLLKTKPGGAKSAKRQPAKK